MSGIKRLSEKYTDKGRLMGGIYYLIIGVAILGYIRRRWGWSYFYDEPLEGFENWRRLLWCLAWSCFGFFCIAYQASKMKNKDKAFPDYATLYPTALFLISLTIYSILQVFKGTSTYIFYFLSVPLCFSLSFMIDVIIFERDKLFKSLFGK